MNSRLDGIILGFRCADESRGRMLHRLASDRKQWNDFMKELKIATVEDLRLLLISPMKPI